MEECLCAGKSAPLSTTLPWWKLALSVCLNHACSLSIRCNCLLQASNMPCNHLFGRGLRIQQIDIVKNIPLFLLCLARVVLVFQLWFAPWQASNGLQLEAQGQIQEKVGMSWKQAHPSKTSTHPCRSYPSHTNAETNAFLVITRQELKSSPFSASASSCLYCSATFWQACGNF